MREYGSQAVVWQTALNPVVALELLAEGEWKGTGALGPEAFPAGPYLGKLAELGSRMPSSSSSRNGHVWRGHLAPTASRDDHREVRRRQERATLDDVIEYLRGIATILMEIDAKLEAFGRANGDDEDEEEAG